MSKPVYEKIGVGYDVHRRPEPRIAARIRAHLGNLGGPHLDLACGTGNYTAPHPGATQVHGVDVSRRMLQRARDKQPGLSWILARGEALPYPDRAFSGGTCILAIHHFDSRRAVFAEVRRVLSGTFVLLTASWEQMRGYWLHEYFPTALRQSIEWMPDTEELLDDLRESGFDTLETEPFEVKPGHRDLFLYGPKHDPELYFDPEVRRGISTFSKLAGEEEVEQGLERLRADLDSGRFEDVKARYEHPAGDYLFVIAK